MLVQLRRAGLALIGVQFLAFCVWSAVLVHRFALTHDFVTYEQAVYLISHGHLNPFSTNVGYPFWQDHGSFLLWPLAFVDRLWPHPVTLLWLQNLLTAGAEAVAFVWVCDLCARRVKRAADPRAADPRSVYACACLALLLVVINPWVTWTVSSDFHTEPLSVVWVVAAARDLFAGRRRMWVWLSFALLSGDVGASSCGALGLSAIVAGRRWWRAGVAVTCAGFGWMILLGALHATRGTVPSYFAPIILGHLGHVPDTTSALTIAKAIIEHPGRAIGAFWSNIVNVWANISAAGVVGITWPPVFLPIALVLVEGALTHGPQASLPGFQNLPVVILGVVGTAAICLKLADRRSDRRRKLLLALLAVLALNAVGWAVVWFSQMSKTWLPVTPEAATTLRQVVQRIEPGDQVVVQQGISTGFARRQFVHLIYNPPTSISVRSRRVWLIFGPSQGSEPAAPAAIAAVMTRIAAMPHVRLVVAANGIWAFLWTPPPDLRRFTLSFGSKPIVAAWAVAGPSGAAVLRGPEHDWHATSNGQPGYVVAGDYWREPTGPVSAQVSLAAATKKTNVELWDDTTGELLRRRTVFNTHGRVTVRLSGLVRPGAVGASYAGWGAWRVNPKQPPGGHVLEIRVWSSGAKGSVSVRSVSLRGAV